MSRHRSTRPRAARLCVVLIGLPLCIAAAGKEPPKSLAERMEREMLRFRIQLQTAQFRLEQGIVGPFDGETRSEGPATPAQVCCSINLRKMRGAVEEMGAIFGEFASCHEAAGNPTAVAAVRFAQNDLAEYSRGVEALAQAPTDERAKGAAAGLVRAYLALLEDTGKIEACDPVAAASPDAAADQETKRKNKDKPKKAKKKSDEGSGD